MNIFSLFFRLRLGVSSESSARQRIHLKHQALFSSKDKSKILKCRLLQFLFGALRVNNVGKHCFMRHAVFTLLQIHMDTVSITGR